MFTVDVKQQQQLLFWFLMFVLSSTCLLSASIVATFIAANYALCRTYDKNQKIGKIDVECFDLFSGCSCLWCDAFVVIVLSDEPRQNQGRGLVDRKQVKVPPPPPNKFYCWPSQGGTLFNSLVALDVVFR